MVVSLALIAAGLLIAGVCTYRLKTEIPRDEASFQAMSDTTTDHWARDRAGGDISKKRGRLTAGAWSSGIPVILGVGNLFLRVV